MNDIELYKGDSESFKYLVKGYVDYAEEIIARRAFPDLRDGLKPVSRRILYSSYKNKSTIKQVTKCHVIVADANKLHPHGESSVYESLCLMTDENGSCNVPLYIGLGSFGKVFSNSGPAAMRYTKARLNTNYMDLFADIDVTDFMPSEEGDGNEPVFLPVRYPLVLVNGTSGMGVSISTDIPHFNFHDVVNLTIKYLKNGSLDITDIIVPDFPTGGILVKNDEELAKIMAIGKGRLKVRAKVEIDGKTINVIQLPCNKTIEGIIGMIDRAEIPDIVSVKNTLDRTNSKYLSIVCKNKKVVESVLLELYRRNILQTSYNSNITVIEDSKPLTIGVHEIIEHWVEWRRIICKRKVEGILESMKKEYETLGYFIRLISNPEWRDTFVDYVIHTNKKKSVGYLKEIFTDIPDDVSDWIYDRRVSAFNNGGKYVERYKVLGNSFSAYEKYLANIDMYIIEDLENLLKENKGMYLRKTEVTNYDYKFSKSVVKEPIDTSYCVYTLKSDGFLTKTRDVVEGDNILCSIESTASSVLIGFDNYGRLIRVKGSDVPFTPYGNDGFYLPRYFDASDYDDYRVMYLCNIDGTTKTLLYSDGYVGFFDTSEFLDKKNNVRIVQRGVDKHVYDCLVEVLDEDSTNNYLLVADDDNGVRFGVIDINTVTRKSRTSRTKALKGKDINIKYCHTFGLMDLHQYIRKPDQYLNAMRKFDGVMYGDVNLMADGRYIDYRVTYLD